MTNRCMGCMSTFDSTFDVCPHCGYVVGSPPEEAIHMVPGSVIANRYIVGKVLGYGGFGVTYIGWDSKLERRVAIKEYLPSEFSTRMPGHSRITVSGGAKSEQFYQGLEKFVDEAKRLAKYQNEPGIVKIFDSFTENETAYIIMEYLEGETLLDRLKRDKLIPENEAVEMLRPVMESLRAVHENGMLHRDIAPDNIFITNGGEVKLIDFGAARYATTTHSRSLTVIVKPGYSPEEQYRSRGDQGPHTDVYALGAVLYKMITGKTPPDAMERRAKFENNNKDILEEPHKLNRGITKIREVAILNAMNVRVEDRTPDIDSFLQELDSDEPADRRKGRIKKLDFFKWPLWAKIAIPAAAAGILTFGVLIATGVISFASLFSSEVHLPDGVAAVPYVEGVDKDAALLMIEEAGLIPAPESNVVSEFVDAGKIVLQSPAGGTYLEINGKVILTVSSGTGVQKAHDGISIVPYIIWDKLEDALDKLKEAGLGEPTVLELADENVAAGMISRISPEPGTTIPEGTAITVYVSTGPQSFEMPDVTGMDMGSAQILLNEKKLSVTVEYRRDSDVEEGNVIMQTPMPGTEVSRGDSATIVVSSGKELAQVPDLTGMSKKEAEAALKERGFSYATLDTYHESIENGKVAGQTPSAGTTQEAGTTVTLYISKGRQPVNVTLNADGGSGTRSRITVYLGGEYGDLPSPTKNGFAFDGWYSSAGGDSQVTSSTTVTMSTDHVLYARWRANSYTVTLDPNGGSTPTGSKLVEYGAAYGDLPVCTRTGYGFDGWYTSAKGGQEVSSSTTCSTADDHTLFAHWLENSYTVTFDGNGGSSSVVSKAVAYSAQYGTLPTATRKGYTFLGWFTGKDTKEQVTEGTTYSLTTEQTLYAHWSANSYTVSFDGNGGTTPSTTLKVTYDTAVGSLPDAKKTGYDFSGWYTEQTGGSAVTTGSLYQHDSDITLFAHWTPKVLTVTLDGNGGAASPASMTAVYDAAYGNIPAATRNGYTFSGWFTAASGGTEVTSGTTVQQGTDHTLFAHWTPNTYTVSFDYASGSGSTSSKNVTFASAYGTLPDATRTGYTFGGWHQSSSSGAAVTESTTVTTYSDHTLYASWTVNTYKIVLDCCGGSCAEASVEREYNTAYGTLPDATRPGYDFDGWYTAAEGGNKISGSTLIGAADVTVFAHWIPRAFTLSFNANGGSCSESPRTVTFGAAYGSLPSASRTGYNFDGWFTASSGGSSVSSGTIMGAGDTTVFAHWTPKSYTYNVVYQSVNGTSLGSTTVTKQFGTTETLSAPSYGGYDTPAGQSVTWDSESKTVTFNYQPSSVSNTTGSGTCTTEPVITYYVEIRFRNRTANSIEMSASLSNTIAKNGWIAHGIAGKFTFGSAGSSSAVIKNYNTSDSFASKTANAERSASATTSWVTVPVNANTRSVSVSMYWYQFNSNGTDLSGSGYGNVSRSFTVSIPTY